MNNGSNMVKKAQINAELAEESVRAHNHYRNRHHAPNITWSNQLALNAQKWADYISVVGQPQHSKPETREGEGENIYCGEGGRTDSRYATRQWYSEIRDYDFDNPPTRFDMKTGHFTQLIWGETKEVGLGRATAKDGRTFIVARYAPNGNGVGEFCDNVRPIREKRESEADSTSSSSSDDDDGAEQGGLEDSGFTLDRYSGESDSGEFEIIFGQRNIDVEETCGINYVQRKYGDKYGSMEYRTEEVSLLTEAVTSGKAAFRQRKDQYIQHGRTYVIIHGFYE